MINYNSLNNEHSCGVAKEFLSVIRAQLTYFLPTVAVELDKLLYFYLLLLCVIFFAFYKFRGRETYHKSYSRYEPAVENRHEDRPDKPSSISAKPTSNLNGRSRFFSLSGHDSQVLGATYNENRQEPANKHGDNDDENDDRGDDEPEGDERGISHQASERFQDSHQQSERFQDKLLERVRCILSDAQASEVKYKSLSAESIIDTNVPDIHQLEDNNIPKRDDYCTSSLHNQLQASCNYQ